MSLLPGLPRSMIAGRDANTVCVQCWRKLGRTPSLPLRQAFFSTVSSHRSGTVVVGKSRNSFGKDFFGKNSILKETFWQSRRELGSSIASAVKTTTGAQQQQPSSTPTPTDDVLPHRRRKLAKELAAQQQQEQSQQDTSSSSTTEAYPIPLDASARLADRAASQTSLKRLFFTYLSLSKPRLSFLVVLTATATYSLYPVPQLLSTAATGSPSLSALTLLFLTTGTALCSASANAFNMLMEPKFDAQMTRTRNRPLVRKLISTRGAVVFAVLCGVVGTAALWVGVNPTTAFLGAANIVLYAGIYTPMKRMSVLNTWVGAVVGGLPPLMGWTAAASQYAHDDGKWEELLFGPDSVGGWLCAALLFAWQFPHFNSLSWSIRDEYKNAGYRMLAWVNPRQNGRVALRYAVLMFPVCIALSLTGITDYSYIATSSVVNGWMAYKAWEFWKHDGHKGTARGLFWASVWHLPIVMVLAMAQKKGLGERLYRSLFGYGDLDEEDELYYEAGELEEEEKEYQRRRVAS
ncbi:Protoheme IX farnesyltransferase, mitochondrial [Curvularia kusanoi]|uniref:Protoheme IX farnesyltransferase, mitochondrial n=1 Tax=Curvularia kusanoi TaxID=90978 RepID=A0A9P4T7U5_CURKU|nr:Protoheme IX farnesyltransferase, mitochondrial [Curvularia kusanoi]